MSIFSEYFSDILKTHNISVSFLAQTSGVNRTVISKVLSGTRNLNINDFDAIVNALKLPDNERAELKNSYVETYFGLYRFDGYLDIVRRLRVKATESPIDTSFKLPKRYAKIESYIDLFNLSSALMLEELKRDGEKCVYTNIPISLTLEILDKYNIRDPELNLHQITTIDKETTNFSSILNLSIRFIESGYHLYYFDTNESIGQHFDVILPYYIITHEGCIFINSELDRGLFTNSTYIFDFYINEIRKILPGTASMAKFNLSTDEIQKFNVEFVTPVTDRFYQYESNLCTALYMTTEIFNQIARPEISNREFLVTSLEEYYRTCFSAIKNKVSLIQLSGLMEFIETGICHELPADYIVPVSPENRLKLLCTLRDTYKEDCNILHFVKTPVHETNNVIIQIADNSAIEGRVRGFVASKNSQLIGDMFIPIDNRAAAMDLAKFINYSQVSRFCLTQDESMKILDDEIEKLKFKIG